MRLVRQRGLLQHDRDLDAGGCRQRIKLNPVRMLRRPFCCDGESGQIGHGYPLDKSMESATIRLAGAVYWSVSTHRTTNIVTPVDLVFACGGGCRGDRLRRNRIEAIKKR